MIFIEENHLMRKKSKRSISCLIPDGHDAWEEQNGYWNVSFHKGKLIYD